LSFPSVFLQEEKEEGEVKEEGVGRGGEEEEEEV
jgi:hypothetical protein